MPPKTVSVIGYGRFGELLANILSAEFSVRVFEPNTAQKLQGSNIEFVTEEQALDSEVLFYCVPISKFEEVLKHHIQILEKKKNW